MLNISGILSCFLASVTIIIPLWKLRANKMIILLLNSLFNFRMDLVLIFAVLTPKRVIKSHAPDLPGEAFPPMVCYHEITVVGIPAKTTAEDVYTLKVF